MRYLRVAPVVLSLIFVLAACSAPAEVKLAPESVLPEFLATAAPRVREAYRFALAHPHDLETVPCYCGCGSMGHTSNLGCFIKNTSANWETSTFEQHAAGCGICVDIAQDVMRMKSDGKQPSEIRRAIDATYSSFGPPTDTPLPNG
jgi:hypothetical protein